ncbi:MAG: integrase core domain-containing protein [Armatimonadota bacterium]
MQPSLVRAVAHGLTLRLDNGSANCSDHFQYEIKRLGITSSFSYVQPPQTNGVLERLNRTLKEQVIYGHVFQNIDEVREAVLHFKQDYNRSCRFAAVYHPSRYAEIHSEKLSPRVA